MSRLEDRRISELNSEQRVENSPDLTQIERVEAALRTAHSQVLPIPVIEAVTLSNEEGKLLVVEKKPEPGKSLSSLREAYLKEAYVPIDLLQEP